MLSVVAVNFYFSLKTLHLGCSEGSPLSDAITVTHRTGLFNTAETLSINMPKPLKYAIMGAPQKSI